MIHTWVSCHSSHYIQMPGKNKQHIWIITTFLYITYHMQYTCSNWWTFWGTCLKCEKQETSTMFQPSSFPATFHPSFFRNWTPTKHGNSHDRLGDFLTNIFSPKKGKGESTNINRCYFFGWYTCPTTCLGLFFLKDNWHSVTFFLGGNCGVFVVG